VVFGKREWESDRVLQRFRGRLLEVRPDLVLLMMRACVLPRAVRYFPVERRLSDGLLFCGGISADRQLFLDQIQQRGVPIQVFGPVHGRRFSRRIAQRDVNQLFNSYRVVLNINLSDSAREACHCGAVTFAGNLSVSTEWFPI